MDDWITKQALDPKWSEGERVHNWRNHIPESIQIMWDTFTLAQKQAIVEWGGALASSEEWE